VRAADRFLGLTVEVLAAILIAAEIVILFAGVVSRYFLHYPLIWSDEIASILFLWLGVLGAVVAFQRGEHMRMTAFVGMASPRVQAFLEAVAVAAALVFLVLLVEPGYEYANDEAFVTTPALELSSAWRAAALPIGLVLMALMAVLRLLKLSGWLPGPWSPSSPSPWCSGCSGPGSSSRAM
jgi:TRAP-type C4-dicarboxylate transport system permease small subunit